MENIYKGDYRRLILIPLALILLAISQIPHLKLGTDFTGGTLIVLQLNKTIDAAHLQSVLRAHGFDATVKVYTTSFGTRAEIEIGKSKELEKVDELRDAFLKQMDKTSQLERTMLYDKQNHLPAYAKDAAAYNESLKKLDSIADQVFELAGVSNRSTDYHSLAKLSSAVFNAYQLTYQHYADKIKGTLEKYVSFKSMSVSSISPSLGKHFLTNALHVALISAILSAITVFLFFRTIVPSIAILTGALSDVTIALGVMALFGIPLTLGSFSALLMLLGFSLDTDILLTMRMLKRKGDPREKAWDAMKTGITMSITALFAFTVLYIVAMWTHISIYGEIASVALAGLFGDLFATWGINAVLLLMHVEGKI